MSFVASRFIARMIGCWLLSATSALATEPEKVAFPSANTAATPLVGYLYRPVGTGPFPAVVAMHGCGGIFNRAGSIQQRDIDWADRLTAAGIAVLFPDSFNPRGVPQVCTLKEAERPVYPFGRSFDANGAADWLATQTFIDKNRIGLIGWSHGGSTVLWTVREGGAPKSTEFKTAIAFYPGCKVPSERPTWKLRLPLKILIGALDDWTPVEPCRDLSVKHAIPLIEYPDAYHGFDAPNSALRILKGLGVTGTGKTEAHIGTNPAAREASIAEVLATLKAAFGMGK